MFTRDLFATAPHGTYFLGGPVCVRLAVLFGTIPSVPVLTQSLYGMIFVNLVRTNETWTAGRDWPAGRNLHTLADLKYTLFIRHLAQGLILEVPLFLELFRSYCSIDCSLIVPC